jgi:hypothetical protein
VSRNLRTVAIAIGMGAALAALFLVFFVLPALMFLPAN